MMFTEFIRPCSNENCCNDTLEIQPISNQEIVSLTSITKRVAQELYSTVYQMPTSLFRLASDIWIHMKHEPKKPSWSIQTTIVMGFLQAFRDQSISNSLEFWRLMLIAPTLIKPINAKIDQEFVQVKKRDLCGILKPLDSEEQGNQLEGEWVSYVSTWERIYGPLDLVASKNQLLLGASPSSEKIVLYLHGGAFCSMSAQTHRSLIHKISKVTKRRVFAVNYRLAPETKFPGALYDVVQTYLYLLETYDPQNIVVMGDSAGGNLCMSLMLYVRDHGLPQPEGAALLSPWVDLTFSYPSWKDASLYDYLPSNPSELTAMNPAQLYLDDPELAKNPYVSPIFADNFDHLPPILIQSGGCESLRDEIVDLTNKMKQSKSTLVHHEVYEDMVHVFQAFPFEKSQDAIESIGWWTKFGIPLIKQLNK